jgi:hypothetical protein
MRKVKLIVHETYQGKRKSEDVFAAVFLSDAAALTPNTHSGIIKDTERSRDSLRSEAERRKAVTDEQAKKIIEKVSGCSNVTEFQNIDSTNKPKMIQKIYKKGVSIRQIIRLTGVSKYNVEKFIK